MENVEKQNVDNLQNNGKKSLNFTILKTCVATLFVCVVAVFYFFAIGFCLFPKTSISISEKMGWKGGELLGYQQVYKQSQTIEDLYNFTIASVSAGANNQTVKCVNEMQERDDYAEFCEKMDISALQSVKLEYVAYLGNVDSYLQNQKVVSLFNSNQKSKAKEEAIQDLARRNKYSFALDAYVSCLANCTNQELKSLSEEQCNGKTVMEWLDIKIQNLNNAIQSTPEKVLAVYTLIKINKVKYAFCIANENQETAEQVLQEISNLQKEYRSLIGA